MRFNNRTPAEQEFINDQMRRREVQEEIFHRALNQPNAASAEHTRRFLELAPPEIHVLLDEILPRYPVAITAPPRHEERIVQLLVGMLVMAKVESLLREGSPQ